jgi:DNA-binding response OmpR family regulator
MIGLVEKNKESLSISKAKNQGLLVIEGNRDMRAFLHSYFSEHFNVTAINNTSQGLVEVKKPTSLILIDFDLENSAGIDFMRKIKSDEIYSNIPVVFISESNESEIRIKALENGASDFITKPFNPRELKARISNLMEDYRIKESLSSKKALSRV